MATKPTEVKQPDWSERVQQIFDVYWKRMLESRPDLESSPEYFKDYFKLVLFRLGPNDYSNILVVWPALKSGPFYMESLKQCVETAWRQAV